MCLSLQCLEANENPVGLFPGLFLSCERDTAWTIGKPAKLPLLAGWPTQPGGRQRVQAGMQPNFLHFLHSI